MGVSAPGKPFCAFSSATWTVRSAKITGSAGERPAVCLIVQRGATVRSVNLVDVGTTDDATAQLQIRAISF